MKIISQITACFIFLSQLSISEELNSGSARWLERGCVSLLVAERDPDNWTKDQEKVGMSVMYWINGFITGFNASCMTGEKASPLAFPPKEWLDSPFITQKILDFIRENPKIRPDSKAREVMTAFYYANHPSSGKREKSFAEMLIKKISENSSTPQPKQNNQKKKPNT